MLIALLQLQEGGHLLKHSKQNFCIHGCNHRDKVNMHETISCKEWMKTLHTNPKKEQYARHNDPQKPLGIRLFISFLFSPRASQFITTISSFPAFQEKPYLLAWVHYLTLAYFITGSPSNGSYGSSTPNDVVASGSSAQGNQPPRNATPETGEEFPFKVWFCETENNDTSRESPLWIDPNVMKFFFVCTHPNSLMGVADAICRRSPWCIEWLGDTKAPFFHFYDTLPLELGIKLPFTHFERSVFRVLNIAPTQLHPNSWTFVRAFELLCEDIGGGTFAECLFLVFLAPSGGESRLDLSKQPIEAEIIEAFRREGPNLLIDNYGDSFFPLYWTSRPTVSITVHRDDLEEWEEEFVEELSHFHTLYSIKLIKNKPEPSCPVEEASHAPSTIVLDSLEGSPTQADTNLDGVQKCVAVEGAIDD
ncbi:hypothetical protein CR513_58132, partial [Mucuna pruriens]